MFKFRQHISIILIAGIFVGIFWQTFTIIHFYLNQDEIEAEYCINKDKPELKCKGQCHLKEQLEKASPDQQDAAKTTGMTKSALLLFAFSNTDSAEQLDLELHANCSCTRGLIVSTGFPRQLINPPEYTL